jgi:hypothetical protein
LRLFQLSTKAAYWWSQYYCALMPLLEIGMHRRTAEMAKLRAALLEFEPGLRLRADNNNGVAAFELVRCLRAKPVPEDGSRYDSGLTHACRLGNAQAMMDLHVRTRWLGGRSSAGSRRRSLPKPALSVATPAQSWLHRFSNGWSLCCLWRGWRSQCRSTWQAAAVTAQTLFVCFYKGKNRPANVLVSLDFEQSAQFPARTSSNAPVSATTAAGPTTRNV